MKRLISLICLFSVFITACHAPSANKEQGGEKVAERLQKATGKDYLENSNTSKKIQERNNFKKLLKNIEIQAKNDSVSLASLLLKCYKGRNLSYGLLAKHTHFLEKIPDSENYQFERTLFKRCDISIIMSDVFR